MIAHKELDALSIHPPQATCNKLSGDKLSEVGFQSSFSVSSCAFPATIRLYFAHQMRRFCVHLINARWIYGLRFIRTACKRRIVARNLHEFMGFVCSSCATIETNAWAISARVLQMCIAKCIHHFRCKITLVMV